MLGLAGWLDGVPVYDNTTKPDRVSINQTRAHLQLGDNVICFLAHTPLSGVSKWSPKPAEPRILVPLKDGAPFLFESMQSFMVISALVNCAPQGVYVLERCRVERVPLAQKPQLLLQHLDGKWGVAADLGC